jgi:tetratricopeptide (TPR) repeat protein
MGLFEIFVKPRLTEEQAISALMRISSFGLGNEDDFKKENMIAVLKKVQNTEDGSRNPRLFYWFGIAWRNFTAWHIRGAERKEYLQKAVDYFSKALDFSKGELPIQLPTEQRHNSDFLGQIDIAGELGVMLVNEKLIRDLDKAERVLEVVYENTSEYEPSLCAFAELFYKKGEYERSAEIGLNISDRIANSPEWKNKPPPAPLGIVGSAYRALAKKAKKEKRFAEAIQWFDKMQHLGIASENDLKILEKLKGAKSRPPND